jgi:hypothetical protein
MLILVVGLKPTAAPVHPKGQASHRSTGIKGYDAVALVFDDCRYHMRDRYLG